ncbi:MAG: TonB-dependent receptor [Pseudomarimonas sp.]
MQLTPPSHRADTPTAARCLAAAGALRQRPLSLALLATTLALPTHTVLAQANERTSIAATELDQIKVEGRRQNLVGEAISASEGIVGASDISDRPLLRVGDLLEFVPGLIATQHSGSGKANQYFLRGFNLDHGTDFATSVDGMPVNMRTHGHGQGYTDLNFLIPESVQTLTYRKGTYYADVGDFSSAGSAEFALADWVETGTLNVSAGQDRYGRIALVNSANRGALEVLYAAEAQVDDGPWQDIDEDVSKLNLLLRMSGDLGDGRAHATLMAYDNEWNSADQIPQRAVEQGLISEFGSLDLSVGGESSRFSLSGGWVGAALGGEIEANAYAIDYELDLWSNFTYLLDDPDNGDQFQQVDDRRIYGFNLSQQWQQGRSRWRVGSVGRFDDIGRVALLRTNQRALLSTVRDDAVEEGSIGVFAANEFDFSDTLRSYIGLRHDRYDFDVDSNLAINSGDADDSITSYKASLAWQPVSKVELYASYGTGFHSNDARGTTIQVDPVSGDPAQRVDPLVGSRGAEIGSRFFFNHQFQATLALWTLRLDSELLFVGDAGATEASRPSQRDGLELGMYWYPDQRYSLSLEASYTDAAFSDDDVAGREIPGSIPLVVSSGVTSHLDHGWSASAQLKHFGSYPLIEDNSVDSDGSTVVNLRVGREWSQWRAYLEVLNFFDSSDHDIDYFYASRLPGEPDEGIEDIHYHVVPSRSLRATVSFLF